MAPQLGRVVNPYGVTVYSSGGFDSLTVKWDAAQRIAERDIPTTVLHVGDHDPSGVTLFEAPAEDVSAFAEDDGGEAEFKRIAVTPAQIATYDLPSAPAKKSSHSAAWRDGEGTVQAEALPPDVLANEIRQAVETELDIDALELAKSGEDENRERLDEMMRHLRGEEGPS